MRHGDHPQTSQFPIRQWLNVSTDAVDMCKNTEFAIFHLPSEIFQEKNFWGENRPQKMATF